MCILVPIVKYADSLCSYLILEQCCELVQNFANRRWYWYLWCMSAYVKKVFKLSIACVTLFMNKNKVLNKWLYKWYLLRLNLWNRDFNAVHKQMTRLMHRPSPCGGMATDFDRRALSQTGLNAGFAAPTVATSPANSARFIQFAVSILLNPHCYKTLTQHVL